MSNELVKYVPSPESKAVHQYNRNLRKQEARQDTFTTWFHYFIILLICVCIIFNAFNNDFKFEGLLNVLSNSHTFDSIKESVSNAKIVEIPTIPVPNVDGIKNVVKGVNSVISMLNSLTEVALAIGSFTKETLSLLFNIFRYIFGV